MQKTTVYLPDDLRSTLRAAARRTRRPQAELIREALERYLADLPSPRFLSIGAAADGGVSGADNEDWIREQWDKR